MSYLSLMQNVPYPHVLWISMCIFVLIAHYAKYRLWYSRCRLFSTVFFHNYLVNDKIFGAKCTLYEMTILIFRTNFVCNVVIYTQKQWDVSVNIRWYLYKFPDIFVILYSGWSFFWHILGKVTHVKVSPNLWWAHFK